MKVQRAAFTIVMERQVMRLVVRQGTPDFTKGALCCRAMRCTARAEVQGTCGGRHKPRAGETAIGDSVSGPAAHLAVASGMLGKLR
eukprot:1339453-Prymnesium_polylepis.1